MRKMLLAVIFTAVVPARGDPVTLKAPRSGTLTLECVTTGERAKLIVD